MRQLENLNAMNCMLNIMNLPNKSLNKYRCVNIVESKIIYIIIRSS